jgi:hypothetical protein
MPTPRWSPCRVPAKGRVRFGRAITPRRRNLTRPPAEARAGTAGQARRTRRTRTPVGATRRACPEGHEPRVRTQGGALPPRGAPELAEPEIRCVITCSLRRSPHGSGRSAPSRDAPLTARFDGRCDESVAERTAGGRTYQPSSSEPMPHCRRCGHAASRHCWQRLAYRDCWECRCPGYLPNNHQPLETYKPLPSVRNPYIRRLRHYRGRG